nr:MAG TPA: hypothetical protein [Caudoviricetes sp.]
MRYGGKNLLKFLLTSVFSFRIFTDFGYFNYSDLFIFSSERAHMLTPIW